MSITVHIVQRMAPGGIETLVLDLAMADQNIRVISLEGETAQLIANWSHLKALGNRFLALNKQQKRTPSLIGIISKQLHNWQASAITAHHIGPLLYGGLGARLAGIPVRVHVEHDGWHYENTKRRRVGRLLDWLVKPRKVAVSHSTANKVRAALNSAHIEVIPNGVDMQRFKPQDAATVRKHFNLPQNVTLIGTLGRLVHVKGHDILIKAMPCLPSYMHVAIVGDGEEREALTTLAKQTGVADRVHFLGHHDKPEDIYPAFDLFCLPSRAEGFPRSLIEAQACNIPVIATDVGGSREAVCPSTGHMVEANNPAKLAEIIQYALENPSALHPRNFVNLTFSFQHTVEAYRRMATY